MKIFPAITPLAAFTALFLCLGAQGQSCLPNGISFATQADIDNFSTNYPGCIKIEGNVLISGINISNLNGLAVLTEIGGLLDIYNNPLLVNLNGLKNITELRSIRVWYNPILTSISGLANVDAALGELWIGGNDVLSDLSGLENIDKTDSLLIYSNSTLTSINALENLASVEMYLDISINPLLPDCAILPICDKLLNGPGIALYIHDNAPGCNSTAEVAAQCGGAPVVVFVFFDENGDGQGDYPVVNIGVQMSAGIQSTLRPTDGDGMAGFFQIEPGPFSLQLPQLANGDWEISQFQTILTSSTGSDSTTVFMFLKPLTHCPGLSVEVGLPSFFRNCLINSTVGVLTKNTGTANAEDVQVAVVMPPGLVFISAVPPPAMQSGDTLFFGMGSLLPFEEAPIQMMVKTDCDNFVIDQTLCLEAFASTGNACPDNLPPHAEIKLSAECIADNTVRFVLKNIGNAPTQGLHAYHIFQNESLLQSGNFNLASQQSMTVDLPADGATYRMEATKFDDGTLTATAIEGCNGLTPGLITAFWLDEGPAHYDFDCRQVIGSYDPNLKSAVPTGAGQEHAIEATRPLQYTIDFQNTGSDTAFRVLLRDVLPLGLDVESFHPLAASHPHTWEIRGQVLEVLFDPIALPHSNVNEPASHGYFSFKIGQKPNLPAGAVLQNEASIFFDFNPAIVTNTVYHTIGYLTVAVDEAQPHVDLWRVEGNPTRAVATFRAAYFIPGQKRFDLFDMAGRRVRSAQFSDQSFEFQRHWLPAGLYFFSISDAQGRRFAGKIVMAAD